MIVGVRPTGLSISITTDLLGFSHITVSGAYTELCNEEKNIQRGTVLWMETPYWLKRYINLDKHSVQLWWAEQHFTMHNMLNLEANGLQTQKTTSGSTSVRRKTQSWGCREDRLAKTKGLKSVTWSDESEFPPRHTDGKVRVWHQQHKSMDLTCLGSEKPECLYVYLFIYFLCKSKLCVDACKTYLNFYFAGAPPSCTGLNDPTGQWR